MLASKGYIWGCETTSLMNGETQHLVTFQLFGMKVRWLKKWHEIGPFRYKLVKTHIH